MFSSKFSSFFSSTCLPPSSFLVVLLSSSPLVGGAAFSTPPLTLPSSSSFLGWWCPSFGCLLNLGGAAFLPHSLGWWCLYSLWCDGAFLPSSPFFWVDVLSASLLVGGAPSLLPPLLLWAGSVFSSPSLGGSALSLFFCVCLGVWECAWECVCVGVQCESPTHTHAHPHTHTRHTHTHPFTATHLQSSFLSPRGLDFDTPILFFVSPWVGL